MVEARRPMERTRQVVAWNFRWTGLFLVGMIWVFLVSDIRGQEPSSWVCEFSEGAFHVHCDFELAQEPLLQELRGITRDLWKFLRVEEPKAKVHVVLFESETEYRRYMRNYFPEVPDRRAIFLQDRGPGMLFAHWHPEIAIDLRHEVTHALLNEKAQIIPLWLDEGLAEYFENPKHSRFQANPYIAQVQEDTQTGRIPSIGQLQSKLTIEELSNEDYRHSWAWVHFMLHRSSDTRLVLVRYLEALRARNATVFDLERALRSVTPQLEAEFKHHFQNVPTPNLSQLAQE